MIRTFYAYHYDEEIKLIKKAGNNIGSRYCEEEYSEESNEECHSHSAIKEHVGNSTWCKCFKFNVEKREIDCFCCLEVTAQNEKFDKFSVKCVTEAEEFQVLCIDEAVLRMY